MMKDEDARLDRVLREWRCPVTSDPGTEAAVWRRIADREASARSERGWAVFVFARPWAGPALAAGLGVAAILGGIGAAEMRMKSDIEYSANQTPSPEQAYFESINPVALAQHAHR